MQRCTWATSGNQLLQQYHDQEWGVSCHDQDRLFELLSLEIMQAGLSWQTVLNKRAAFRTAFANFSVSKVKLLQSQLPSLLNNPTIIRNRRKLQAIINNAQMITKLNQAGINFDQYIWQFVHFKPIVHHYHNHAEIPATDAFAQRMSKQMKRDGFKFTGPVVMYAFMQAAGLINDHEVTCACYAKIINHDYA